MLAAVRPLCVLLLTGLLTACASGRPTAEKVTVDTSHQKVPTYPPRAAHEGLQGVVVSFCAVQPSGASQCHVAYSSDPIFIDSARPTIESLAFRPGPGDPHYRTTLRYLRPGFHSDDDTVLVRVRAGRPFEAVRFDCRVGLDAHAHDCGSGQTETPDAIGPARAVLAATPFPPGFEVERAVPRRATLTVKFIPPGVDAYNPFN